MVVISGRERAIARCKAGIVGFFPALTCETPALTPVLTGVDKRDDAVSGIIFMLR